MPKRIRFYASACFYYSGLVSLARWWTERSGPRLTILYYHQAARADLRSHWSYLRRHYRILPLEAALEELQVRSRGTEAAPGDRRSLLAVTFDDGYYDNYALAFPLARELEVPITIFLIAEYIDAGNAFWWLTRLIRRGRATQAIFAGRTYELGLPEECKALALALDARFNQITEPVERQKFIASLYTLLNIPSSVTLKEDPAPLMTWEQVRELQESTWITLGAHTLYHPDLSLLATPEEVRHEVGVSRKMLQERLKLPVRSFAYPFGGIGAYGAAAAKEAGYDWAVTTRPGPNTADSDPHLLKRRNMDGPKHWIVVAAETAGIWSIFSTLKKTARALLRPGAATS